MIINVIASVSGDATGITGNIELILSVIAIVVSIGCVIFEYFWTCKINIVNMDSEYVKQIYDEYLIYQIPRARRKIHHGENEIEGIDEITHILNDIRRDSIFYKYTDNDFYKELCEVLHKTEDYAVKKSGKMTDDEYVEFTKDLNGQIEDIYRIIHTKYIGKKKRKKIKIVRE